MFYFTATGNSLFIAKQFSDAPLGIPQELKKGNLISVITFGNASVNVAEWWNNFAKGHGLNNNYVNSILMVDNYLPVFDMNEQMKIDKKTDENIATIISDIIGRKDFIAPSDMGWFTEDMLKNMQDMHFSQTCNQLIKLDTSRCIECSTCIDVCPRGNFSLTPEK